VWFSAFVEHMLLSSTLAVVDEEEFRALVVEKLSIFVFLNRRRLWGVGGGFQIQELRILAIRSL
jgi:hypothetical protein